MQSYTVDIAGAPVTLPIVPINQKLAISLLMVIDMGVQFGERIGKALAEKLGPLKPDIVVGAATLGIPVVIEVSRALGLDQYVIAQKSPKIHLGDALVQEVQSVTTSEQAAPDARPPLGAAAGATSRGRGRRRRGDRLEPRRNAGARALGGRQHRRRRRDPDRRPRLGKGARRRCAGWSRASGTSRNSRSPTARRRRCRRRFRSTWFPISVNLRRAGFSAVGAS